VPSIRPKLGGQLSYPVSMIEQRINDAGDRLVDRQSRLAADLPPMGDRHRRISLTATTRLSSPSMSNDAASFTFVMNR
jgi:hypothetical protein